MLAWPVTRGDLKVSCSTLAAKPEEITPHDGFLHRVYVDIDGETIRCHLPLQLAKGVALEDWLAVEGVLKGVESPTARRG